MAIKFLNTVAVDTNVLYVDAASNEVGINTTDGGYALRVNGQIYSESSTYPVYYLKRNTSATGGSFSTLTGIASSFKLETDSSGTITDGFGGGIVFSLGDISPNTAARIYARRDGGDQTGALQFWGGVDGDTVLMTMRASGKVGIGDTDPGAKLVVAQPQITSGGFSTPFIELKSTAQTNNTGLVAMSFSTSTADNYGYSIGALRGSSGGASSFVISHHDNSLTGSERMLIDSSGNIGIDTTDPSEKLHVNNGFLKVQPPVISGTTPPSITIRSLINQYQSGIESGGHLTMKSAGSTSYFYWYQGSTNVMRYSNALYVNKIVDLDNTAYYLDPSSSEVSLHINGIVDQDFEVTNLNTAWTAPGASRDQGFIFGRFQSTASNAPGTNDHANWFANIYSHSSGGTASYGIQLAGSNAGSGENALQLRNVSNGSFASWRKVFHDGYHPNADTWTTTRTITLGGDLSGSVSIDGSADVTLSATVANDSHTHDDRYYTESEMQTYFKRGYIGSHSASNLAVGWYTIATNTGDRALGEFQIWESAGGRHQSVLFNASHHYGTDSSNDLTVLANSRYSADVFRYIRIKENSTYDGAVLQVYIENSTNTVQAAITGANAQTSGWVLQDWVADATTPSGVSNYSNFTEKCKIDLDNTRDGGMETTGKFHAQDLIQSSYSSSLYARFESNSSGGVVKGVGGGGFLARSYGDTYFNGGNFGIGTSNPDTKLHVEGNLLVDAYAVGQDNGIFLREGYLSTDQPSITVWDMSNGGASPDGLSINANDGIRFRENGSEVARFKDGSFGINVTNPSSILHVDEPSLNASSLTFGAAAGQIFQNENSEFAFGLHNASPYPLYIQGRTTSNSARTIALNPSGGQVNIGTLTSATSSYKLNMGGSIDMNAYNIDYVNQLHFQDGVRFYDDGNDNYLNFKWNDTGGGGMRFRDGDSAIMGTVYGDGGDQFGLLDADGSWAVRIDKDVAVDLRVNNSSRIICDTGGTEFRNGGTVVGEVTTAGLARFASDVVAYYSFSDQRLKTDIKATTNNLDKILKLEPVEYTWKDGGREGKKEIGLIAQDVEKVVPEVVRENERLNDDTLYKQVDYEHLVSTLIGAIQEQQKQIDELKSIINGGS